MVIKTFARCRDGAQPKSSEDGGEVGQSLRGFHRSRHGGGVMKKQMFALLGLSLMLATVSAYGQTVRVKANIPFNFTVTGATLPAGAYTIESLTSDGKALSIRDSDKKFQGMVLSTRCESLNYAEKTKL